MRHHENGTIFIQSFCDVFDEFWTGEDDDNSDVLSLSTKVHFCSKCSNRDNGLTFGTLYYLQIGPV